LPDLIVIYGPPLAGKSTLARELGRALPAKTAIVSADYLLDEAIAHRDDDAVAEIDLVHQQLRLLVANYLKFGYACILEGPFIYEREGRLLNFESQIDQLLALMRMMTLRRMIIRIGASDEELATRAARIGRGSELALATRIEAGYKERRAPELRVYNTGAHATDEIVTSILAELQGMPRGQA
jgi:adenylate kinase family enzyme